MAGEQQFDVTLKEFFKEQAKEVLSQLIPGIEIIEEHNIEAIRPTLRGDMLYTALYHGTPHMVQVELQTEADEDMSYRLLVYHALFLDDYRLPVLSVVIYPFRVKMIESPFQEMSGNRALLTFEFEVVSLESLDAEQYVREHVISMYPLMPTMHGANADLLLQAMDELGGLFKGKRLARKLLWFGTLMRRAKTVSPEDKIRVQERLNMWDDLLEDDEYIKKIKERVAAEERAKAEVIAAEERARAEAIAAEERARIEAEYQENVRELQKTIVNIVHGRFPALTELAQEKVTHIEKPALLYTLITQTAIAPDENVARFVLSTQAA